MTQQANIIWTIWEVLLTIPESVWTALMGSAFTLFGVLIANHHSQKQLAAQLAADAEESAKQRRAEMRKAVYLEGADELVKENAAIGSLPQTDLSKVNAGQELKGFFASMVKLQLVGDPKTARLANGLASSYGEVLGQLIVQVMPIRNAASTLELHDARYEEHQLSMRRILAEMAPGTDAGDANAPGAVTRSRAFDFHKKQAETIEAERVTLRSIQKALQFDFMKSVAATTKALSLQLLPLMIELRRELDVGGDYDDFKELLEEQAERMQQMLDRVASDLQSVS